MRSQLGTTVVTLPAVYSPPDTRSKSKSWALFDGVPPRVRPRRKRLQKYTAIDQRRAIKTMTREQLSTTCKYFFDSIVPYGVLNGITDQVKSTVKSLSEQEQKPAHNYLLGRAKNHLAAAEDLWVYHPAYRVCSSFLPAPETRALKWRDVDKSKALKGNLFFMQQFCKHHNISMDSSIKVDGWLAHKWVEGAEKLKVCADFLGEKLGDIEISDCDEAVARKLAESLQAYFPADISDLSEAELNSVLEGVMYRFSNEVDGMLRELMPTQEEAHTFLKMMIPSIYQLAFKASASERYDTLLGSLRKLMSYRLFMTQHFDGVLDDKCISQDTFFSALYNKYAPEGSKPLLFARGYKIATQLSKVPRDGSVARVAVKTCSLHWHSMFVRWNNDDNCYEIANYDSLEEGSRYSLSSKRLCEWLMAVNPGVNFRVFRIDLQRQADENTCAAFAWHDIKNSFKHDPFEFRTRCPRQRMEQMFRPEKGEGSCEVYRFTDVHPAYLKTNQISETMKQYRESHPDRCLSEDFAKLEKTLEAENVRLYPNKEKVVNGFASRKLVKWSVLAATAQLGIEPDLSRTSEGMTLYQPARQEPSDMETNG